jgi:hypothetical protein
MIEIKTFGNNRELIISIFIIGLDLKIKSNIKILRLKKK